MTRTRASYRTKRNKNNNNNDMPTETTPNPPVHLGHSTNTLPSIGSSLKQGFGFGIGSSIANNLAQSILSKPKIDCISIQDQYEFCLMDSNCSKESMENITKLWNQCFKK